MSNRWFLCGDIHGRPHPIENFIRRMEGKYEFDGSDKIILLGDAGFNFYLGDRHYQSGKADENFKKKMSKFPFTYYVVRGNHEERPSKMMATSPEFWKYTYDEEVHGMVYYEMKFPQIRYFDDIPTVYYINGYDTLVMGGAYSIDKYYRLMNNWTWFAGEQMTEEERQIALDLCEAEDWQFDLVLSHTCPICFEPTDLFLQNIDQSTVDKSMERLFGEIEYKLNYGVWCWGHFHEYRDYPRCGDGRAQLMLAWDYLVDLTQIMEEDIPEKL